MSQVRAVSVTRNSYTCQHAAGMREFSQVCLLMRLHQWPVSHLDAPIVLIVICTSAAANQISSISPLLPYDQTPCCPLLVTVAPLLSQVNAIRRNSVKALNTCTAACNLHSKTASADLWERSLPTTCEMQLLTARRMADWLSRRDWESLGAPDAPSVHRRFGVKSAS